MRKGSMDNYDVVFCCGEHQREEVEANNRINKTRNKKIVNWGYSLLDDMIKDYKKIKPKDSKKKTVMIAPSWQKDRFLRFWREKNMM